jgi:hypothetical protein
LGFSGREKAGTVTGGGNNCFADAFLRHIKRSTCKV